VGIENHRRFRTVPFLRKQESNGPESARPGRRKEEKTAAGIPGIDPFQAGLWDRSLAGSSNIGPIQPSLNHGKKPVL